ncbi:hypothetical protein U1Q18_005845 [Sarracenia purpurea var. burkii]
MCKMLMSLEKEDEVEMLRKDVGLVYEAMLAFPLRLPWTRFHKGLQDTTASAITWMVKYLDENKEVLDTLKAEQLSLAAKSSHKSLLSLEDLNDMPYASKEIRA